MLLVHSVVVITVGTQSGDSPFETYGQPIYDSCFIKLVIRISGVMKP